MAGNSSRRRPMPRRSPPRHPFPQSSHTRRAIAAAAARIMAQDGLNDVGLAKRKAARSLGVADSESLPGNEEVLEELQAYQAFYQAEEHGEQLREYRQAAIEVMGMLAEFHPHLTGPVLEGTAGWAGMVELELFADSAKDVEMALLSRNIQYDVKESRRDPSNLEAKLRMDWEGVPVVIAVYPPLAERQIRRNPHTGKSRQRADIHEVQQLLAEAHPS